MINKPPNTDGTPARISAKIRENPVKGKLPCGARVCYRCHEECGVIVNAYILKDLANETKEK